jgi:hypothetical protein
LGQLKLLQAGVPILNQESLETQAESTAGRQFFQAFQQIYIL